MKSFLRYLKVWWLMSKNSFVSVFYSKLSLTLFLIAKTLRFVFFFMFIFFLLKGTNSLAGYNLNQTIFFFLTFNLVDVTTQFLFREVYRFRGQVVTGGLDLTLSKPLSPLFRSLMGGADVIDLITIPPLVIAVIYVGRLLNPSLLHTTFYLLLVLNGFLISTAFHIAVLALGIITLEIDHTIMIYRDVTNLGRFPVDIYKQPLQGILTFIVPVGIMITLPAKALMGLISPIGVFSSFLIGMATIFLSIQFWNFALTKYTSASS